MASTLESRRKSRGSSFQFLSSSPPSVARHRPRRAPRRQPGPDRTAFQSARRHLSAISESFGFDTLHTRLKRRLIRWKRSQNPPFMERRGSVRFAGRNLSLKSEKPLLSPNGQIHEVESGGWDKGHTPGVISDAASVPFSG